MQLIVVVIFRNLYPFLILTIDFSFIDDSGEFLLIWAKLTARAYNEIKDVIEKQN